MLKVSINFEKSLSLMPLVIQSCLMAPDIYYDVKRRAASFLTLIALEQKYNIL